MGLKFFERIRKKDGGVESKEISVRELCGMAQECAARELAFNACVNMIAGALGRCEFRTYDAGNEIFGDLYWTFNYSPNKYQNSTSFLHKLVHQLYTDNEALLVPLPTDDSIPRYAVADSWSVPENFAVKTRQYLNIVIEGKNYFLEDPYENSVLHIELHGTNIKPVLDGVTRAYENLIQAAMNNYTFANGQHWKVKISQMAQGQDGWMEQLQKMVDDQLKPFLSSSVAVFPETEGWTLENADKDVEKGRDASDIKKLYEDIFTFTANAFGIPPVLLLGQVQGTEDAMRRFLTACVDPLADQLSEEITRKLYGFEKWKKGSYLRVDTSTINHFDLFANAPNVEKLIGSGYSYNDVQRAAGMPTINEPWANEHFLTKNFAKAETVLKGEQAE